MRAGIDTGGYQGLPQTGMTPLVHHEVAVAGHTSRIHVCCGVHNNQTYTLQFTGCNTAVQHINTPVHGHT